MPRRPRYMANTAGPEPAAAAATIEEVKTPLIKNLYVDKEMLKYVLIGLGAGALLGIISQKDAGTTFGWALIGGLGGAVVGKVKTKM